jgi:hypothetical protein
VICRCDEAENFPDVDISPHRHAERSPAPIITHRLLNTPNANSDKTLNSIGAGQRGNFIANVKSEI